MGHNHVVSSNLKPTGIPQVDGLSTGPPDLGRHNVHLFYLLPTKQFLLFIYLMTTH